MLYFHYQSVIALCMKS